MTPLVPLDRRQLLKLALITAGTVALPSFVGGGLYLDAQGRPLRIDDPYVASDGLDAWPARPGAATPLLILLNRQSPNPFGPFLSEMLQAEGVNCYQVADVSGIHEAPLAWYDTILLADGPLSASQQEHLTTYVADGGGLVVMRPQASLYPWLGLESAGGTLDAGYLFVDGNCPIARGIDAGRLQFHGSADRSVATTAQVVAWLGSRDTGIEPHPALVYREHGKGCMAAWLFDLARSIAYTRQGNPQMANLERDGGDGIRAADMFKNWIDLDRLVVPQADEEQRLLINLLTYMANRRRPLPRLWYFPGRAETIVVATGDSHGNPSSAIEDVLTRVERKGGRFSVYYTAFPSSDVRRATKKAVYRVAELQRTISRQMPAPFPGDVEHWRQRGHEFSLHPYVEDGLGAGWEQHWREFTGLGYGTAMRTVRTHRILWTGWTETALVQATHGFRMNFDYYHWGPLFQSRQGEWLYGYMTGSGLPMRFIDEQGRLLNIYQQLTQMADDHWLNLHWGGVAKISADAALDIVRAMVVDSLAGAYSVLTGHFHVDPYAIGGQWLPQAERWLEGFLDIANTYSLPVVSADDWYGFTSARASTTFSNIEWFAEQGRLRLELSSPGQTAERLGVMFPLEHEGRRLADVAVDGAIQGFLTRRVGGVVYGWVTVPAGDHQLAATYAN